MQKHYLIHLLLLLHLHSLLPRCFKMSSATINSASMLVISISSLTVKQACGCLDMIKPSHEPYCRFLHLALYQSLLVIAWQLQCIMLKESMLMLALVSCHVCCSYMTMHLHFRRR
ncbi:hypothetical protein EDD17DRAFT_56640 [Pisolithus thermaeus]|nr:hypothetical protein EDD17DRAFT_56640 [Pisolithus thermaeus]